MSILHCIYRTCCWAGACDCHPIIIIWSIISSRQLYWRIYSASVHTATRWNLPHKLRSYTLDRHWLRHKSHCWKGWDFQQSKLLWRLRSKYWRPHFWWASNFWRSDVFWRSPPWPFCWTCHWRATHNHLRSKAAVKSSLLINIPGQETSGRYVIVQINSQTYLHFQEVKAFGRATTLQLWASSLSSSSLSRSGFMALAEAFNI